MGDTPADRTPSDAPAPSGTFEPVRTAIEAGTLIGEYEVEAPIGKGGMGTVYRAVQPIIGKKVAIKILSSRLARNKEALQRFVQEARAVNEIGHRNLVDIFSFGRLTDGRYYYVMDYLEGRTLASLLDERRRLPSREAFPIFLDVGRALEAAHEKGVVHRDLKPDNVMLVPEPGGGPPRARLLDFGVAKLLEEDFDGRAPVTGVGHTMGTPHYMSPEQCQGFKIDARADVYALGVMLYEALTGRPPFEAESPGDVMRAHVDLIPRRPRDLEPGLVSPDVDSLIMHMLAKDPKDRFPGAHEFCKVLRGMMSAEKITASGVFPALGGAAVIEKVQVRKAPGSADVVPLGAPASAPAPPAAAAGAPRQSGSMRSAEAESLSDFLGLSIEEPAAITGETSQASALSIDLSVNTPPPAVLVARAAGRAGIQERFGHLDPPPLAPPKTRATRRGSQHGVAEMAGEGGGAVVEERERAPTRLPEILVVVAILAALGSIAAVIFIRQ